MSEEHDTLAQVRAIIDELPHPQRQAVYRMAQRLRDAWEAEPQINYLALALVGAEVAAS